MTNLNSEADTSKPGPENTQTTDSTSQGTFLASGWATAKSPSKKEQN